MWWQHVIFFANLIIQRLKLLLRISFDLHNMVDSNFNHEESSNSNEESCVNVSGSLKNVSNIRAMSICKLIMFIYSWNWYLSFGFLPDAQNPYKYLNPLYEVFELSLDRWYCSILCFRKHSNKIKSWFNFFQSRSRSAIISLSKDIT